MEITNQTLDAARTVDFAMFSPWRGLCRLAPSLDRGNHDPAGCSCQWRRFVARPRPTTPGFRQAAFSPVATLLCRAVMLLANHHTLAVHGQRRRADPPQRCLTPVDVPAGDVEARSGDPARRSGGR